MDISKKPLKVLLTGMIDFGHLSSCLGIGVMLLNRGHEVYIAHFPRNRQITESQGIKFISLYDYADPDKPLSDDKPRDSAIFKPRFLKSLKVDILSALKEAASAGNTNSGLLDVLEKSKGETVAMMKIIEEIKPDICLADYLWPAPWMYTAECPVIPIKSGNPVGLYSGPPSNSGYSVHDDPSLWHEFDLLKAKVDQVLVDKVTEVFDSFKVPFIDRYHVKYFGIYIFPGPLDYHELGSPKEKWVRLDSAIRKSDQGDFEIPEKLKDKPGKLIYISMGTLASTVSEMITMILDPLANLPHRFIVSTGPAGDSIKLHDNMWGDKFINQIGLLPKVDLFITHGGSNSLIEGLAAGKPLIVIPQFGDQPDNAQRIADLKLGARIDLFGFSGEKLVKTVEEVLNSKEINENVARISAELKNTDSNDKVISMIEQLAITKVSPI